MAVYFASDMHLRLDCPDRAERLAEWVDSLTPADSLFLVGDICDFWYATRQIQNGACSCAGLTALASFRHRGGSLTVLLGNHDLWLGPFYQQELGATLVQEPFRVEVAGLRFHLAHGHRSGGRQPWKAAMESHAFYRAFAALPDAIATRLDQRLNTTNERGRVQDEDRLIQVFAGLACQLGESADLAVFGHVHRPVDQPTTGSRLIVLGGWHHGSSYLRVDEKGAYLHRTQKPTSSQVG
ncbi:MAG: UDP-2,3-diacylglucosamine diphosphatase [Isosphaeraceae bacterium]